MSEMVRMAWSKQKGGLLDAVAAGRRNGYDATGERGGYDLLRNREREGIMVGGLRRRLRLLFEMASLLSVLEV